jgi:hypothetical protein
MTELSVCTLTWPPRAMRRGLLRVPGHPAQVSTRLKRASPKPFDGDPHTRLARAVRLPQFT